MFMCVGVLLLGGSVLVTLMIALEDFTQELVRTKDDDLRLPVEFSVSLYGACLGAYSSLTPSSWLAICGIVINLVGGVQVLRTSSKQ